MAYHKPLGDYTGRCGGCNNFEYVETKRRIERFGKCVLPNRVNYHQACQKACRLYEPYNDGTEKGENQSEKEGNVEWI